MACLRIYGGGEGTLEKVSETYWDRSWLQDCDLCWVEVDIAIGLCGVEFGPHQLWEIGGNLCC